MRTTIASVAVLAGAAFMFVAGLGVARLPDVYTRMHAATKPATVGVAAIMSGVALALYEVPVTARSALVAIFFLLTAPVAAHAIARSAHSRRVPLAPGTRVEGPAANDERLASRPRRRPTAERGAHAGRVGPPDGEDAERDQQQWMPEVPAAQKEERP